MIPRKLFRVCVEGNIGSGKTTFLNFFSNRKNVHLCYEPLHKWRNFGKDNLLELMYKDPIRWSHLFQTYVQLTMLEQHLEECHKPTKLMERSLFSARYCFVENLHKTGKISDAEYGVYCRWYDMIVKVLDVDVDLIVYLRTDPKMLHERILKRHRQEERAISLEYLESLHQLHEDWLITKQTRCLSLPPVLVINANLPLSQMHSQYEKYEHKIIQDDLSLPPVLPVLEPCVDHHG